MPYPSIQPLPQAPNRATDTQQEFSNNADAFLGGLGLFRTQVNDAGEYVEGKASESESSANAASISAANAASSEQIALAASNIQGRWEDIAPSIEGTKGETFFHKGGYWALLVDVVDVALTEPSSSNPDWGFISRPNWCAKVTQSMTLHENCKFNAEAIGGGIDLTLPTMEVGDYVVIRNSIVSDSNVRVVNNGYTIQAKYATLSTNDNIIVEPDDNCYLLCSGVNILEIV